MTREQMIKTIRYEMDHNFRNVSEEERRFVLRGQPVHGRNWYKEVKGLPIDVLQAWVGQIEERSGKAKAKGRRK